jgi:hypothetical protein
LTSITLASPSNHLAAPLPGIAVFGAVDRANGVITSNASDGLVQPLNNTSTPAAAADVRG